MCLCDGCNEHALTYSTPYVFCGGWGRHCKGSDGCNEHVLTSCKHTHPVCVCAAGDIAKDLIGAMSMHTSMCVCLCAAENIAKNLKGAMSVH